jgi:4-hydroxy-3-polyprenylbenzoate decarboxylase
VIAARGPVLRKLSHEIPSNLSLPSSCKRVDLIIPGVIGVTFKSFVDYPSAQQELQELVQTLSSHQLDAWPLWILTEDSHWMSQHLNNFLWVTFTRSQPAKDIYGVEANFIDKHWTCKSPLIIDARIKPHHAPILETDPMISKKVDQLFTSGGALHGKVKGI